MGRVRIKRACSIGFRGQKGVALVIVLWVLLLITISTGAYTLMARMDQLEAHTVISGTRARMAAEAGLNLAILSLRDPDETTRLVPDGRPYTIQLEDVMVEVQVTDPPSSITESPTATGSRLDVKWPSDRAEIRITIADPR